VIAPASELIDKGPTFISTELRHLEADYVENRPGRFQYTGLSESSFLKLFFWAIRGGNTF
jgi:hypothetical protein